MAPLRYVSLSLVLLCSFNVKAAVREIPRFVSIKSNEVNVRSGPGAKYPVTWVYTVKSLPLEVIAEYEHWRQVRDIEGKGGWIHSSRLSGKRTVIIKDNKEVLLYNSANITSRILVKFHPNVICTLDKCKDEWCKVKYQEYIGWIQKKYLWGVYSGDKW